MNVKCLRNLMLKFEKNNLAQSRFFNMFSFQSRFCFGFKQSRDCSDFRLMRRLIFRKNPDDAGVEGDKWKRKRVSRSVIHSDV